MEVTKKSIVQMLIRLETDLSVTLFEFSFLDRCLIYVFRLTSRVQRAHGKQQSTQ